MLSLLARERAVHCNLNHYPIQFQSNPINPLLIHTNNEQLLLFNNNVDGWSGWQPAEGCSDDGLDSCRNGEQWDGEQRGRLQAIERQGWWVFNKERQTIVITITISSRHIHIVSCSPQLPRPGQESVYTKPGHIQQVLGYNVGGDVDWRWRV